MDNTKQTYSGNFVEVATGDPIRITGGRVLVMRDTHTSNRHQPARKWYQAARPASTLAYAEAKVADGKWQVA